MGVAIPKGHQAAALPYSVNAGHIDVCLITSRDTRRWVLPKGWTEKRLAPHEVAVLEALEEAGLVGSVETVAIGRYTYVKDGILPCSVDVFPLFVTKQLLDWKESAERDRQWLRSDLAAALVEEPMLAELLSDLDDLLL